MKMLGSAVTIAIAGCVSLTVLMVPANAAQQCPTYPTRSNFGSYSSFSSTTFGARARIELNNPDLCGNDTTGPGLSAAWSMVTAPSAFSGRHEGWAQSGYIDLGDAEPAFDAKGVHVFFQFTRACLVRGNCSAGADEYVTKFFGAPASGSHFHANYLRASDDRIHMSADGTDLGEVGYDVSGDWGPAWSAQFGVEVDHDEDDVPGTANDPTDFDYLQRYLQNGTVNYVTNLSVTPLTGPRYHRGLLNPPARGLGFFVWTNPLS